MADDKPLPQEQVKSIVDQLLGRFAEPVASSPASAQTSKKWNDGFSNPKARALKKSPPR